MKINIYAVCLLLLSTHCFANYESLKMYKQDVKNQVKTEKAAPLKRSNSQFVIDFVDINAMDIYNLHQKYGLTLTQCIADGICIFKFDNNQTNRVQLDEIIKKEVNIKQIKEYKPYEFRPF
jgi:hypothetical protein